MKMHLNKNNLNLINMKTKINVFWILTVITLSMTLLSSCKDDDWEPLKWTVDNMNPENIVLKNKPDYDYGIQQTIIANEEGGEIIFYCENYDDLYLIGNGYAINNNTFDNGIIFIQANEDKIIINFPKLEEIPEKGSWVILDVKTRNNKNPKTVFMIGRNSDLNYLD